jgi:hypothetical protein
MFDIGVNESFSISLMVESGVGDEHYISALLKIHFDPGMVRSLGHRAMHLHLFTVFVY